MSEPDDFDNDDCWNCGGEGFYYDCQDEIGCIDPEGGCDLCERRCWVCRPREPQTARMTPRTQKDDGR